MGFRGTFMGLPYGTFTGILHGTSMKLQGISLALLGDSVG